MSDGGCLLELPHPFHDEKRHHIRDDRDAESALVTHCSISNRAPNTHRPLTARDERIIQSLGKPRRSTRSRSSPHPLTRSASPDRTQPARWPAIGPPSPALSRGEPRRWELLEEHRRVDLVLASPGEAPPALPRGRQMCLLSCRSPGGQTVTRPHRRPVYQTHVRNSGYPGLRSFSFR
jgi:hypothetical protein